MLRQRPTDGNIAPYRAYILIIIAMIVLSVAILPFDTFVSASVTSNSSIALEFIAKVNDAVQAQWYLVPAVLLILAIAATDWSGRSFRTQRRLYGGVGMLMFMTLSLAGSGILVNALKQFVGRGRPVTLMEEGTAFVLRPFEFEYAYQGYPSGHATVAGSIGIILAIWYPKWRWPLMAASFALAFGRVPTGSHYLSDVVAGFALGAVFTLTLARWLSSRCALFSRNDEHILPVLNSRLLR